MASDESVPRFAGFDSPTYTMVPDQLFDELLPHLGLGELRVLLYIIRRTFGFKKAVDTISLAQMVDGITTREGTVLDHGTGLSKKSVLSALTSLEERGIITSQRRQSEERGHEATAYALCVREAGLPPLGKQVHQGVGKASTPSLGEPAPPSPWGSKYTHKKTEGQQTEGQRGDTRAWRTAPGEDRRGPERFTSGTYGTCPHCLERPCTEDCPSQRQRA